MAERYDSASPSRADSILSSIASIRSDLSSAKKWRHSRWRHTLGIILLLATVVLWTASNFLASTIFADNTYSKPFFVTYVNSTFFIIPFIPIVLRKLYNDPAELASLRQLLPARFHGSSAIYTPINPDADAEERSAFLKPNGRHTRETLRAGSPSSSTDLNDNLVQSQILNKDPSLEKLTIVETARLSFEFCLLWFTANYFMASCLEYTTVASSTILTSTSSIWTLLIGTLWGVEIFSYRKLAGVLASLAGIMLISTVDLSGSNDENRGSFPHKSPREIAAGDAMAFFSAILYGLYAVVMKKRMGDEGRVNMPMFFGMVGVLNLVLLWPFFIILHVVGLETFELPPAGRVLTIILVNSTSSLVSDFCWAYAMLLTSPLIVTVGLSLTIPLSLIGQMVLDAQYSSFLYWVGAVVVFMSFIFINHEESKEQQPVEAAESGVMYDSAIST
ncbi:hypothetical protein EJ08DRAFT_669481 [Tothia fuscella]|uniref:DUF3955 domain-containing protein n=1 Tax=Tothia fuscella TaxID=1048955 RepID=A0A9P4NUF8_9PEZI|nr:hypothetical protein EJ08DRAFT_669481 [Tothia fuscella]